MKRSPLKRKQIRVELTPDEWKRTWGTCPLCSREGWIFAHHIIEKRTLRKLGLTEHMWDRRNRMDVCDLCHARHHEYVKRIRREDLPAVVFEFARETGTVFVLDRLYPEEEAAA